MDARFSFRELVRFLLSRWKTILLLAVAFAILGGFYGFFSWSLEPGADAQLQVVLTVHVDDSLLMADKDVAYENDRMRKQRQITYLLGDPTIYDSTVRDPAFDWEAIFAQPNDNTEAALEGMAATLQEKLLVTTDASGTGFIYLSATANNLEACQSLIDIYRPHAEAAVDAYYGEGLVTFQPLGSRVIEPGSGAGTDSLRDRLMGGVRQAILLGIGGGMLIVFLYVVIYLLRDYAGSTSMYERYRLPLFATASLAGKDIQKEGERLAYNLDAYFDGKGGKEVMVLSVGSIRNGQAQIEKIVAAAEGVRMAAVGGAAGALEGYTLHYEDPSNESPMLYRLASTCDGILLVIRDTHTTHEQVIDTIKGLVDTDKRIMGIIETA